MTEPPEWLVKSIALTIWGHGCGFAEWQLTTSRAVLTEIRKHGKLLAQEPTEQMCDAAHHGIRPYDKASGVLSTAPQWPEEPK